MPSIITVAQIHAVEGQLGVRKLALPLGGSLGGNLLDQDDADSWYVI